jgi:D-alanyl-D-alanine carboxypeptidase/D-alanyl-D-alanine-endopeptidase (penicillin-binding protein 4)
MLYAHARQSAPLVDFDSRSLADMIYPILNSSQNWFAEMLLKTVGRRVEGAGSWRAGLAAERRFLIDSVGVDSTAFALSDGSGLSSGNLITPRAFARLLAYMLHHSSGAGFMHAMPRSGERGSLRNRFVDTPLEGRVLAKTGSIFRVQTLTGYIERPGQSPLIFSVMANSYVGRYSGMMAVIDSVVVEMGRGR